MKKIYTAFALLVCLAYLPMSVVQGQMMKRQDYVWARNTAGAAITLDGNMNEAAWAKADSLVIKYGEGSGLPTSGWKCEYNPDVVTDPTNAVVKFLVNPPYLYIGFNVPDSSVGGTADWARWDGILLSVKNKASKNRPIDAIELFYSYWYVNVPQFAVAGGPPRFIGNQYGNFTDTSRTDAQRAVWDAKTVVVGGQSNDAGRDKAWNTEMRIRLDSLGYDVTGVNGDCVEINFSIWDCDYLYEGTASKINTTRTHWQSPWANTNANNVGRVFIKPDVTVNSGSSPVVAADVVIPNAANAPEPAIDGDLNEWAWNGAYTFEIAYNDTNIRKTYPGVGPYMSGQFQPELVASSKPPVIDPSYAKIKMFFRNNYLYVGADVDDQIVQGNATYDAVDGLGIIIGARNSRNDDNNMDFRLLRINFGADNIAHGYDYMPTLMDSSQTSFAVKLKGATTVGVNTDIDEGFKVEAKIDLKGLGYPADLGDKVLFVGAVLYDGDVFQDPLNNYGTRTWWFREHAGGPAVAWAYLDPNKPVGVEKEESKMLPNSVELKGNYPNPFNPSTKISFSVPSNGEALIRVFDVLGKEVKTLNAAVSAGENNVNFNAYPLTSGLYIYRVNFKDQMTGKLMQSAAGKMVLVK